MARRVCIVLGLFLCLATAVFAGLWIRAERRYEDLRITTRQRNETSGVLSDSLRLVNGRLFAVEALQKFWYGSAQAAAANQRMLLGDSEIRKLKKLGLTDPVRQLRQDLVAHPELIPYKGVLGGVMHFWEPRVALLSTRWVFAEFEDGHIAGNCLLEYSVSPGGHVSWKLLAAVLI